MGGDSHGEAIPLHGAARDAVATRRALLDASLDAVVLIDAAGTVVEWNAAAEQVLQFSRAEVLGRRMVDLIVPEELREAHEQGMRRYLATREAHVLGKRIEITALRRDGRVVPVELAISEVEGTDPLVFTGFIRDISARRHAERRERVLSRVAEMFAVPLDAAARARWTADLVAEEIAPACQVALTVDRMALPSETRGDADHLRPALEEALRAGPAQFQERGTSVMAVPLRVEGRTIGAVALELTDSGEDIAEAEFELLQELAGRCALAIDRGRIFEERSRETAVLQESLLPSTLPEAPGLAAAAAFHAAGDIASLGGDFYDLFAIGPDRWAAVVGDVQGKGPKAAAVTAQVRHSLRAICDQHRLPSEALHRLNALLLASPGDPMCTAALLFVSTEGGGADVTMSLAGHPGPLLHEREGELASIGAPGPLLGAFRDAEWTDSTRRLEPRDRLVIVTDGMLDQRRAGLRSYVHDELVELVATLRDDHPSVVAERLVAWAVQAQDGQPADDTAVLVLQSEPPRASDAPVLSDAFLRYKGAFPAQPVSVGVIRGEMAAIAKECGMSDSAVAEVRLAVSEAASNAVLHGTPEDGGVVRVAAYLRDGELTVVITDQGEGMAPRLDSPGIGLGLPVIASVTKSMEITYDDGTAVVMTFHRPTGAPQ